MNSAKQKILETSARLFEKQGYYATGLNEIIRESNIPKGSLYYYFPEGKEQIGAETALWSAAQMAEHIRFGLSQAYKPDEAVRLLGYKIADAIEESSFTSGGPLMLLAAESAVNSETLNNACCTAYALMLAVFSEKFFGNNDLALFVMSTLEGAILLSRVNHSGDPLRRAAENLKKFIQMEMGK